MNYVLLNTTKGTLGVPGIGAVAPGTSFTTDDITKEIADLLDKNLLAYIAPSEVTTLLYAYIPILQTNIDLALGVLDIYQNPEVQVVDKETLLLNGAILLRNILDNLSDTPKILLTERDARTQNTFEWVVLNYLYVAARSLVETLEIITSDYPMEYPLYDSVASVMTALTAIRTQLSQ